MLSLSLSLPDADHGLEELRAGGERALSSSIVTALIEVSHRSIKFSEVTSSVPYRLVAAERGVTVLLETLLKQNHRHRNKI